MPSVYAIGVTNDELTAGLHDPDPARRTENAEVIGALHVYLALPYLLDAARSDSDANVRKTARQAVIALSPSEHAADRAIAGQPPAGAPPGSTQKGQVAAVIALFNELAAARETPSSTPDETSVLYAVVDYLGAWGGRSAQDLDEVGLAGAMAVGAICRFVEIPDEEAGTKFTSFQDAKERVADYESVLASRAL
jgi:hypothetical protein